MTENPKFFAVFYHRSQNLPIVMVVSSEDKFYELCETFLTDWAHLMDVETGEIIESYSKEQSSWRNNA